VAISRATRKIAEAVPERKPMIIEKKLHLNINAELILREINHLASEE